MNWEIYDKVFSLNFPSICSLDLKKGANVINVNDSKMSRRNYSNIKALSEKINISESTLQMYKNWCLIDGEFYYFKTAYLFSELLLAELARIFNIRCVEFMVASYYGKTGIISKNFRQNDKTYLNYEELHKTNNANATRNYGLFTEFLSTIMNSNNKNQLLNELSRLTAFDFFSGQKDRFSYNLFFESDNDSIKLAPQTDNGSAFKPYDMNLLENCYNELAFPQTNEVMQEEFDTLLYIIRDEVFRNYLILCLDINIDAVISDTLTKHGLILSEDDREMIIEYFDSKKRIIDNTLSLIKKEN